MKECLNCSDPFEPKNHIQKFCHFLCAEAYNGNKRGTYLIFSRDGFRCIYCGRSSIEDEIKLHADHIVPRSDGGDDTASNLVTSCKQCNLQKSAKELPQTTLRRIQNVLEKRNEEHNLSSKQSIDL